MMDVIIAGIATRGLLNVSICFQIALALAHSDGVRNGIASDGFSLTPDFIRKSFSAHHPT